MSLEARDDEGLVPQHGRADGFAMKHIGAISGGKDSVCMAVLLKETHPEIDFEWVFTPTGDELPEFYAHMQRLRALIGPITPIMVPGGLKGLVEKWNALPNWRQRWCTRVLKIEPFAAYLMKNTPARFYVGMRADEDEREGGDYQHVPDVEMVFPLREAGMGLEDVLRFNMERQIIIPRRTDCGKCFFQRLIEWYELWRDNLPSYLEAEEWETMTGHTFRSPGRDTWPAALKDLRARFEAGDIPRDTRPDPINGMKCRVCRQ